MRICVEGGEGFNKGLRSGEELAWSKLRHLIGAASTKRSC